MGRPYHFDDRTVQLLRGGQEALAAEIGNGHFALYDCLRRVVSTTATVDAFLIALFRDDKHILYVYQYDGEVYAPPGVRTLNPDGPSGWVYRNKRPYFYNSDGGAVLNQGITWGDTERRSRDAMFVPMRRTNSDEIIGVVSAQTYTPNSYDARELAALEWLTGLLGRILSTEDEQRHLVRSLDYERQPPSSASTTLDIINAIIQQADEVRQTAARVAESLGAEGHHLYESARQVVRECERLQIEAVELEFDSYREAAFRFSTLSPRERDVARLLVDGATNVDISDRLHISLATVKTHIGNILKKYGAKQRATVISQMRTYLGHP